jgi:hypothetical protein
MTRWEKAAHCCQQILPGPECAREKESKIERKIGGVSEKYITMSNHENITQTK